MDKSFGDLQERYAQLCGLLAPHKPRYSSQSTVHTSARDDGSAHVEFVDKKFNYVITERGSELKRKIAQSEDELLFWLMDDVTTGIALEFESKNRIPGEDFRRQYFSKNIELLTRLSSDWALRKASEYQKILGQHPYRDDAHLIVKAETASRSG
ncbi:MAG: Imm63 family immunity protein [Stenotrophomonas sp.]